MPHLWKLSIQFIFCFVLFLKKQSLNTSHLRMVCLDTRNQSDSFNIVLFTSRISCLSSHLSTSGPSSVSALYTANLAMRIAAASWSKDAAMFWICVCASAQLQKKNTSICIAVKEKMSNLKIALQNEGKESSVSSWTNSGWSFKKSTGCKWAVSQSTIHSLEMFLICTDAMQPVKENIMTLIKQLLYLKNINYER